MKYRTGVIPSQAAAAGITIKEYLLEMYNRHGSLNKIAHALGISEHAVKYHARAQGLQVICILADEARRVEIEDVAS